MKKPSPDSTPGGQGDGISLRYLEDGEGFYYIQTSQENLLANHFTFFYWFKFL
jgi:hypothetical protein